MCSSEQFSIQLDESRDNSSAAQSIVLVHYPWEGDTLENFLFFKEVPGRTPGEEKFRLLDAFMTEARLSWKKCVAVCMYGTAAMTCRMSGVTLRIKSVSPRIMATHCMLHQQALASKDMEPDLHSVLNTAVTEVNFVKSRELQSYLFGRLCLDINAGHDSLLYPCEVRWVSHGKVLQRVYELCIEMA